jgi:transcriptional regulator with XRE-family HTH domain
MINRIRDIRAQKGMTLAQVAAACDPPTTAQTIGRLETGMRNLSLVWMNRIAAALDVEPELLLRSENEGGEAQVTAVLTAAGVEAPAKPMDALLPIALASEGALRVVMVEAVSGDYRVGDQVWLREWPLDRLDDAHDCDVLAPLADGRFVFGKLGAGTTITPAEGDTVTLKDPEWLAVAEMLVRKL